MNIIGDQQTSRILWWLDEASRYGELIGGLEQRAQVFQRLASQYAYHEQNPPFLRCAAEVSRIADSSDNHHLQAETYAELAQVHARSGDRQRARQLVIQAESAFLCLPDGFQKEMASRGISWAAGEAGDYALAEMRARRRGEMDELRLLLDRCRWYLINADAKLADNAIADAATAVDRFCVGSVDDRFKKQDLLDKLLDVFLQANKIDSAELLAEQMDFSSLQARYLAERQWKLGRKRQYQTTISRQRSFVLRIEDPCGNYHGPMSELQSIADLQREIGDRTGYAVTLEETERFASNADESPSWIKTAVFGTLAAIQYRGGDTDASDRSLRTARAAAEDQTSNPRAEKSLRNTVWLSVSDAEIKLRRFDAALQSANRIPKRETRVSRMAKVFARADRDSDAAGLVHAAKSPEGAAQLCLWVATHIGMED